MKKLFAAVMLCVVLSGTTYADEIRIQGGGTSIAAVFTPIKSRFEKLYGHNLNIVQSSAVQALIALQEGKVEVATAAHPLEDLVAGAAKEGIAIDASALVATQVEDNRLVVIVNRSNAVTKLSKEQLKDLFSGKITNWKGVGGADAAVEVIWGKDTHGQNIQFSRVVLEGVPVTTKTREATTYRSILQLVSEVPGAIGIVPSQMISPVIRVVETVPMVSSIYAITKGAPSEKVRQVLNFYQSEYGFLKE